MAKKKLLSVFDLLAKMSRQSVKITYTTAGGKQLSKKSGNAIIEFVVDNKTFQDFAYHKTYGEPKSENSDMYYMAVIFSKKEYDLLLKKTKSPTRPKKSVEKLDNELQSDKNRG